MNIKWIIFRLLFLALSNLLSRKIFCFCVVVLSPLTKRKDLGWVTLGPSHSAMMSRVRKCATSEDVKPYEIPVCGSSPLESRTRESWLSLCLIIKVFLENIVSDIPVAVKFSDVSCCWESQSEVTTVTLLSWHALWPGFFYVCVKQR